MQKIENTLWFDTQAEEAAQFYTSLFEDASIGRTSYYGPAGAKVAGMPEGSVLTVEFTLAGQKFSALNGGKAFKFTPANSLLIYCETQEEIDCLWHALSEGGETMDCGWVTDKYGLTWQVVPVQLDEMLADEDPEKAERVMEAFLAMKKIDIVCLRKAYRGE